MISKTLPAKSSMTSMREYNTMSAAVIVAPRKIKTKKVSIPDPGEGEVRIRLEGSGVCASSLPVWEGRNWFTYPVAAGNPGHEGWGIVDAIGEKVYNIEAGTRVACLTYNAFAEYDIAKAENIVPLPAFLNNKPFPGEAFGCALNIFKRADIKASHIVAIVGAGFLGMLLIQLAKSAGATVIAVSRRPFSLYTARENGADFIVQIEDYHKAIDSVEKITGGKLCDRVIEATGEEYPLNLSIELTKEKGRLIVAGFHQGEMRCVNMQLLNWRGIDMINAHERDPLEYIKGIHKAIKAIERGDMNPFALLTHIIPLESAAQAFELLQTRPDGFVKALLINSFFKYDQ